MGGSNPWHGLAKLAGIRLILWTWITVRTELPGRTPCLAKHSMAQASTWKAGARLAEMQCWHVHAMLFLLHSADGHLPTNATCGCFS